VVDKTERERQPSTEVATPYGVAVAVAVQLKTPQAVTVEPQLTVEPAVPAPLTPLHHPPALSLVVAVAAPKAATVVLAAPANVSFTCTDHELRTSR
jgi:hypothetical protein